MAQADAVSSNPTVARQIPAPADAANAIREAMFRRLWADHDNEGRVIGVADPEAFR